MKITPHKQPFEFLIVDDLYTDEELRLMQREMDFLQAKMKPAKETLGAITDTGAPIKQNSAIFLERVYADRTVSDILRINHKTLSPEIRAAMADLHPSYAMMHSVNTYTTLLNYYANTDSYPAHSDSSRYTAVTFFPPDPLEYTGGDFEFTEFNLTVEQKPNRMVLFPGIIKHAVTPVTLNHPDAKGRFSMAQFINYIEVDR